MLIASIDQNAHLGSADTTVAILAGLLFFLLGLLVVGVISRRLLGASSDGLALYIYLVVIGCVVVTFFGPFFLAPDSPIYDEQALGVAESIREEETEAALTNGKEGWPILLGSVYYIFGRVTFVGIIINCVATAVSAIYVTRTAEIIFGSSSRRRMILWYLCTPLLALLGPSLLREALCWLGISLMCFALASVFRGRVSALWTGAIGVFIFGAVRTSLAILVLVALILGWLIVVLIKKKKRLTLLLASVMCVTLASTVLRLALNGLGVTEASLQANREYISVEATTGFSSGSLQPGIGGFLTTAVQGFPRLLFGPFPWEFEFAPVWIWVGINTIAWLTILYLAIRSTFQIQEKTISLVLLTAAGLLLLAMSVSLTNYGIVVRMRGSTMILLLPLVLGKYAPRRSADERQSFRSMTGQSSRKFLSK
ncbi:hypothetical protein [Cryobacterium sp. Y29]|uniref:hypothetical protein n=1 Tax=Cryobacterium sp. Y29 TaxID=2048285 RepID=UPI000CE55A63|nr:hypothetical protein [Cryobacterium sp. Y29]